MMSTVAAVVRVMIKKTGEHYHVSPVWYSAAANCRC
jgi:hypothetical protein